MNPQADVKVAARQPAATRVKPIFIVGVPRSGTTLLVNLIGLHPQLAPIFETRFLRNLLQHCEYASWYWSTARSRRLLSLFGETLLRSRFTARCEAYRAKIISFHSSRDFSNGRRSELPFDRQIVLYTCDELVKETDRWIGNLLSGPVPESQVYGEARKLVGALFSLHSARMDKPYWVNKTPGLLTELR
ncbi:MAG TPA: sulfotransferase, partial [Candidatus Binatia bacterium]|nr:sulfotransferase [Candidatus Binatia bacterium]